MNLHKFFDLFRSPEEESPIPSIVSGNEGYLDTYSDTWIFVSRWAESELERLRIANDSVSLTTEKTAAIRGRIKFAKDLLALPDKERMKRVRPKKDEDEEYD